MERREPWATAGRKGRRVRKSKAAGEEKREASSRPGFGVASTVSLSFSRRRPSYPYLGPVRDETAADGHKARTESCMGCCTGGRTSGVLSSLATHSAARRVTFGLVRGQTSDRLWPHPDPGWCRFCALPLGRSENTSRCSRGNLKISVFLSPSQSVALRASKRFKRGSRSLRAHEVARALSTSTSREISKRTDPRLFASKYWFKLRSHCCFTKWSRYI
jgi:hypothetical protein